MEECFKCHAPETRAILFEVISSAGIVKVCGRCYGKENFPLVSKEGSFKKHKEQGVYERMLKLSGMNRRKVEPPKIKKQDISLRRIVNENLEKNLGNFSNNPEDKKGFFYNFHWIVMKGRRNKHMTPEQLAEAIKEPERVVKLVEKGYVPKDRKIIRKIEECLNVRLRKEVSEEEKKEFTESYWEKEPEFSRVNSGGEVDIKESRNLTISDLQELKKSKERKIFRKQEEDNKNEFFDDEIEITEDFNEFFESDDLEDYGFDKEEENGKKF